MPRKLTKEEWINKSNKVHNFKYDYSKVVYVNSLIKVIIICPIHGEFEQLPNSHSFGKGCLQCGNNKEQLYLGIDEFIRRSNLVHPKDKFDYSKSVYKGTKNKIEIHCNDCGNDFWQFPDKHMLGIDCPYCANRVTLTGKEWIKKCSENFDNKYDYSLINLDEKIYSKKFVRIICPEHGEFEIRADIHVFGQGCPYCSGYKLNTQTFIEKSLKIHGDKYDYSLVDYKFSDQKVEIICHKHGIFKQTPNSHLTGSGCPECNIEKTISKAEQEIFDILNNWKILDIQQSNRTILSYNHELDLYLPDYNLAIEYNGLYWHSSEFRDNLYHQNKYLNCYKKGINLIQIFEDEWILQKEKVIDKLKGYLNIQKDNVMDINQCIIEEYDNQDTFDLWCFEEDNYLEIDDLRHEKSDINIVLKHDNEIVSILSLNKENDNKYIITRFFDKLNYQINDSFKTLLNWFIQNFKPSKITYLDDLRWSQEKLLLDNGFVFDKLMEPKEYQHCKYNRLQNKNEINKKFLINNAGYKLWKIIKY